MSNGYFHVLTKHEYQMTRCQDGIIFVPNRRFIRNSTFCQKVTINNDLYVINNKDIFQLIRMRKQ